jgi:hypothetical protein
MDMGTDMVMEMNMDMQHEHICKNEDDPNRHRHRSANKASIKATFCNHVYIDNVITSFREIT